MFFVALSKHNSTSTDREDAPVRFGIKCAREQSQKGQVQNDSIEKDSFFFHSQAEAFVRFLSYFVIELKHISVHKKQYLFPFTGNTQLC